MGTTRLSGEPVDLSSIGVPWMDTSQFNHEIQHEDLGIQLQDDISELKDIHQIDSFIENQLPPLDRNMQYLEDLQNLAKHSPSIDPYNKSEPSPEPELELDFLSTKTIKNSLQTSQSDHPKINCIICGFDDRIEVVLRCRTCEKGYHGQCLNPPIEKSDNSWKCPSCNNGEEKTNSIESTNWEPPEQHAFFSCMKGKLKGLQQFDTSQFEYISSRIGTKTALQVEQYFNRQLRRINELLSPYGFNIDKKNPDDVRVALLSKYRVCLDYLKKGRSTVRLDDPIIRREFAEQLHASYVRSHKQMMIAKSNKKRAIELKNQNNENNLDIAIERAKHGACRALYPTVETTPQKDLVDHSKIHTPPVRRKRKIMQDKNIEDSSPSISNWKRMKTQKHLESHHEDHLYYQPSNLEYSCSTPKTLRKRIGSTPPSSKRKSRVTLRIRLVPIDTSTKRIIVKSGLTPKVELKLNGSVKISYVCSHLSKKWKIVEEKMPQGSELRVVPLGDRMHPGWGCEDISVNCLTLAKRFGDVHENEGNMTLEYRWQRIHDYNYPTQVNYPSSTNVSSTPTLKENPLQIPPGIKNCEDNSSKFVFELTDLLDDGACGRISDIIEEKNGNEELSIGEQISTRNSVHIETPQSIRKKKLRRITPTLITNGISSV